MGQLQHLSQVAAEGGEGGRGGPASVCLELGWKEAIQPFTRLPLTRQMPVGPLGLQRTAGFTSWLCLRSLGYLDKLPSLSMPSFPCL